VARVAPRAFQPYDSELSLVDSVDNACGQVERRQVPILQVYLRVGNLSNTNCDVVSQLYVKSTQDRPLTPEAFDRFWWFYARDGRFSEAPPISRTPKDGYVGLTPDAGRSAAAVFGPLPPRQSGMAFAETLPASIPRPRGSQIRGSLV
jgi:hypothetical protein